MKKAISLVLALMMVVTVLCIGAGAADVTITPEATIGGQTVTMTATGVQEQFTNFDIGSLFGMPGSFGFTYALWFDSNGTFSFDKDVTLTHQYFDASFASLGTDEVLVKAGEVIKIADGVYSSVNGTTVAWSEFSVAMDDGNSWMIVDSSDPGNYANTPADTSLYSFPGTVGAAAAAAPAEPEPAPAPAEPEPAPAPAEPEPAPAPAEPEPAPAEPAPAPAEPAPAPAEPAPAPAPAPAAPAVASGTYNAAAGTYTVAAGDCLWTICQKIYGIGTKWGDVWAANADIISNPRLIFPGQVLRMP